LLMEEIPAMFFIMIIITLKGSRRIGDTKRRLFRRADIMTALGVIIMSPAGIISLELGIGDTELGKVVKSHLVVDN